MRAPKFEECPARLVLEKGMQDFIKIPVRRLQRITEG